MFFSNFEACNSFSQIIFSNDPVDTFIKSEAVPSYSTFVAIKHILSALVLGLGKDFVTDKLSLKILKITLVNNSLSYRVKICFIKVTIHFIVTNFNTWPV